MARQPRVVGGFDPVKRFHGVLVRRGKAVLGGETIFDRNDDGLGVVGEVDAEIVEVSGGGAVENEAATVVEDDEG